MKLFVFTLALFFALLCIATATTLTAETFVATPPTDESALKANMNRFIISKNTVEAKPFQTTWLSVQYNAQVVNQLDWWFLQFSHPEYFYYFDLNQVYYQSSRSYFYTPSAPNNVYVYEIQPQTKTVNGVGITFSNFKYFYCGVTTMDKYQSSLQNEQNHQQLGDNCQEVGPIQWNTGYLLSHWVWYLTDTAYYTQNSPQYKLITNPDVLYGGMNQDSQYFYSSAYGRSCLYPILSGQTTPQKNALQAPLPSQQQQQQPLKSFPAFRDENLKGYAKTNITFSIYPTYNQVWGWTVPYDTQYFSIRSINAAPVCVFTNLKTGIQFNAPLTKFTKDNLYYAAMSPTIVADGFHFNCQVTVTTQAQQNGWQYAYVPVRIHDIIGKTFDFELSSNSAEVPRAQADSWLDYQQDVIEVAWY